MKMYLLSDFGERGSIFFLQISIVKVGEGWRRGESSRFPQLPDVEPGHGQQHEEAQQVDPHLPAGRVTHHWNRHATQVLKATASYLHFISGSIKLGLITVCILYFMGEFDHCRKCTVKTSRRLNKLAITEPSQPLVQALPPGTERGDDCMWETAGCIKFYVNQTTVWEKIWQNVTDTLRCCSELNVRVSHVAFQRGGYEPAPSWLPQDELHLWEDFDSFISTF